VHVHVYVLSLGNHQGVRYAAAGSPHVHADKELTVLVGSFCFRSYERRAM